MRLTGQFEMRFAGQKNANTQLPLTDLFVREMLRVEMRCSAVDGMPKTFSLRSH